MDTLTVSLLVGSVRDGRAADALLPWLVPRLSARDWVSLEVVDLRDHPVAAWTDAPSPVADVLARSDAFVVLVPEYNHSFPGVLKAAIDAHSREWARKPVTFVAYGAASGGARAVEQLRQVFPELGAVTTRNVVLVPAPWAHLDAGRYVAPDAVEGALDATLTELRWWAEALAVARGSAVPA